MSPRPLPLIWSAMAASPAHCGQESDVPPMPYQPVLQGAEPQISPLWPYFTQVVWAMTLRVGCGKATGNDGNEYWVCNYDPAGNMDGESPFE